MTPMESYLADLSAVRGAGTAETSGYPALANLFNEVGGTLKPKITAIIHPANSGAGLPDGGFFSSKELKKHPDETSLFALKPERGVLEVKPISYDLNALAQTSQVRNYLEHYGQILLTNYRSFALWTWEAGKPAAGETFFLAESESLFWELARQPREHPRLGERLFEYLRRVLLHAARLAAPRDLAAYLASYAREARARVEGAESNTLAPVSEALGEALGIRFEGEKGAHFFRSTLIQTLFYGVFSAWVLWNEGNPKPGDRFRWREAAYHLGLPVLRTLFHQLADPQKLRDLGLEEVLDWTESTLARVERADFFARFRLGEAVQYFYEPFLAEFDPELRKQFGVWYTPPELVRYMVARVDRALRENYGIPDGLADPRVVVLDPCCGTGAYLVETLRIIYAHWKDTYGEAQAQLQTKAAAQTRLFGFELLPAPYVIAHLQIDLLLARFGAPLIHEPEKAKKGEKQKEPERAGVFLTNALTGWVPPEEPKTLLFPELAAERDAADRVKREAEILVIIGNPPYSGFAGIAIGEERALSEAYRTVKAAPAPQGQGLNELYVRFFRMAERRIVEGVPNADVPGAQPPAPGAHGIVCYISNYSWLDGLSHPGMRERFLEVFDRITVDCLNGDKRETGKRTPEGKPDPSVFSTEHNREGIGVGTAIALLERWPAKPAGMTPLGAEVRFRNWWGAEKAVELLASLAPEKVSPYMDVVPVLALGLGFKPQTVSAQYVTWPLLPTLFPWKCPGVNSSRDSALTDIDEYRLRRRMQRYFDPKSDSEEMREEMPSLFESTQRFNASAVRNHLLQSGIDSGRFIRFAYRPYETRWLYWHPETKLLDEKRDELVGMIREGNWLMGSRQKAERSREGSPFAVTRQLGDRHMTRPGTTFFPLYIWEGGTAQAKAGDLFASIPAKRRTNLSPMARTYLAKLRCPDPDTDDETSGLLWFHTLAIGHSPAYIAENAGALRQDWPRVPIPQSADTLRSGAALGRRVATLLDPEADVPGVTDKKILPGLSGLAELTIAADAKPKTPDLALTAHWGYAGQGGVVMPGPGDVRSAARGEGFVDIYLNATTRWRDVPAAVWSYTLGGYQVLKKWLSYREAVLLHRPLTADEALDFTKYVRRLTALLALHIDLDNHYHISATTAIKAGST